MPLIYTTLVSDTFDRANENPLNPAVWSKDPSGVNSPLQIVSDNAVNTSVSQGIGVYVGIAWPNNQWAQVQVNVCNGNATDTEASVLLVMHRKNEGNGFAFEVDGPLGDSCGITVFSESDANGIIEYTAEDLLVPLFAGDLIRMELFNGLVSAFIIHNGVSTQILAPTLGDATLASGNVAINMFDNTELTDAAVSNFQGGSISAVPLVITPNVNSSQALIPVGFPLVSVARSNPLASTEFTSVPTNGTGAAQSVKQQAAIDQAGESNSRVI